MVHFPSKLHGVVLLPSISLVDDGEKLMLALNALGGSSGSPVYNEKGLVIGIVVSVNKINNGVSFATPSKHIIKFLEGALDK